MNRGDQKCSTKLKTMRNNINWKNEEHRWILFNQFDHLVKNWEGQLPNLREIFQPVEMDWLLVEGIKDRFNFVHFKEFVIKTGYKDEPEIDRDGQPLFRRTTPIHHMFRRRHPSENCDCDLFEIYDRFDVNYTDEFGYSHFHVACMFNCYEVVEKFLQLDQDPNCVQPQTGDSPLHLTLKYYQHIKVTELLLKNGANPNSVNRKESTPLHIICERYFADAVLAGLFFKINDDLQQMVQIDYQDKLGRTALHLAVECGNTKLTELLLRRGANSNLADKKGRTILHMICEIEFSDKWVIFLKLFFEINNKNYQIVHVDAKDIYFRTPLYTALIHDNLKMAELLLREGANPNLAPKDGETPLHLICKRCDKRDDDEDYDDEGICLLKVLFEISDDKKHHVQVDARNEWGDTPLELAVKYGYKKAAETLLRSGADPNLVNAEGLTPLHVIIRSTRDNLDEDFVEKFFNICDEKNQVVQVDAQDKLGRTPLQLAVVNLKPGVVDTLLDHGADLSTFVFPTESDFDEVLKCIDSRLCLKLELASATMAIVKNLKKRGYDLDRRGALTIMKTFAKHELFEKSADLKLWLSNKDFVNKTKKTTIRRDGDNDDENDEEAAREAQKSLKRPNLTLYDLIRLQPEEAKKLFTYEDYLDFADKLGYYYWGIPERYEELCFVHLCEIMSKGLFRHWALDPFLDLMRYQLPILCCEKIIDLLTNEDLFSICLAGEIVAKEESQNT